MASTGLDELVRVQDLWFPEGGLILQAGNRLFRVAGSILAARSSVFKDMLAIPQPETQPTIEGCPIVVLHDESEDVEYFLKAIFDSRFSFERPPKPTKFVVVAGVLRLSTKYDVGYLRHRALLHLSPLSPVSLEEFDNYYDNIRDTTKFFEVFSRLLLGNSLGLQWVISCALYEASCNGTVDEILCGFNDPGPRMELPLDLQRICIKSRNSLVFAQLHDTLGFLVTPHIRGCLSDDQCRANRTSFYRGLTVSDDLTPLKYFDAEAWSWSDNCPYCAVCLVACQDEYEEGRQRVWDGLPVMFGLPSWDELRRARDADLAELE
ncbi:hypothetical protein FB45DRAFT_844566 [Roridomyces roridus]|uniref:BTB domain-containing protein n=1 Tax=Roridomyces roridus TaxID=1738132 RepID=A0AAD7B5C2_9AGAR|nr:hypothetical protein FB45DRAFT_844566 [Roridomyces roridus]